MYFNHSLLHFPAVPRNEYKRMSGHGDWADSLLELDGDFGELLDQIDGLGLRDNTIVVFAGDNGNEEYLLHRGTAGFWEGSLFTGMEGSLRDLVIGSGLAFEERGAHELKGVPGEWRLLSVASA